MTKGLSTLAAAIAALALSGGVSAQAVSPGAGGAATLGTPNPNASSGIGAGTTGSSLPPAGANAPGTPTTNFGTGGVRPLPGTPGAAMPGTVPGTPGFGAPGAASPTAPQAPGNGG